MENEFKKIGIKNRTCNYFEDTFIEDKPILMVLMLIKFYWTKNKMKGF